VAQVTAAGAARPRSTALFFEWRDQTFRLADGENIIGRAADCCVAIDATTVSRRHARVTVALGKATLEDLNSTNGTFVNSAPVSAPTALKDGDEVSCGTAALRFHASV